MLRRLRRLRQQGPAAKVAVRTLWFLGQDPTVGRWPRLLARLAVLYLYSPIDLIPDFIPVIGHLDDLLVVPMISRIVRRFSSPAAWDEAYHHAEQSTAAGVDPIPLSYRRAWVLLAALALTLIALAVCAGWLMLSHLLAAFRSH